MLMVLLYNVSVLEIRFLGGTCQADLSAQVVGTKTRPSGQPTAASHAEVAERCTNLKRLNLLHQILLPLKQVAKSSLRGLLGSDELRSAGAIGASRLDAVPIAGTTQIPPSPMTPTGVTMRKTIVRPNKAPLPLFLES